jgi:hypothetical protein
MEKFEVGFRPLAEADLFELYRHIADVVIAGPLEGASKFFSQLLLFCGPK